MEEIEDEDYSPAVNALHYEEDGPIMIEIPPNNPSSDHHDEGYGD